MAQLQPDRTFTVPPDLAGQTLAAALRAVAGELSWAQTKHLITTRRVEVNGVLCLNDARRVSGGDVIRVHEHSRPPVPDQQDIRILHIDSDLIVIDKPAGIATLRRDEEQDFTDQRKELQPTVDELLPRMLPGAARSNRPVRRPNQRSKTKNQKSIYAVHRLDRDTSGLMLFALSPRARDALIAMFSKHKVRRKYVAVVHGRLEGPRTIESWIIRDRGDGLRGSSALGQNDPIAQRAITHITPIEHIGGAYTVIECRLQTGRTHQIRIHLCEIGHMLCGEKLYLSATADGPVRNDESGAPRQALHSAELELVHPTTGQRLHFTSPLPRDLAGWLQRVKDRSSNADPQPRSGGIE